MLVTIVASIACFIVGGILSYVLFKYGLKAKYDNVLKEAETEAEVIKKNKLLEVNFENARCTYDTNMNRYVTKKRSLGKVDMVVALINAIYLLQQEVLLDEDDGWVCQTV